MNKNTIKNWLALPVKDKNLVFANIAAKQIPPIPEAVEKDWWVVRTLEIIFTTSIAPHTVFKGGTSLSKAWNLIQRFSEDIDLALDRKFLGISMSDEQITNAQVRKLRNASANFISTKYIHELQAAFADFGLGNVEIKIPHLNTKDTDPINIEIYYPSILEANEYIKPRILVEIGSRSLIDPFDIISINSYIGEEYITQSFADKPIAIPCVNPQRTFLEKIFLLHEEFQKLLDKIRIDRKSRHLFDIEKLMDTSFTLAALQNKELYETIVLHRKKLTALRGVNYDNHIPAKISIIPPNEILHLWQADYDKMQLNMIYGKSLTFTQLIERLKLLQARINTINF
jgi:Nucleotidyl transferase AbiEii toxin, Type IV TA system